MTARLTEATCALRALAPFCYNGVNLRNRRPSMQSKSHSSYEYNRMWRFKNREQHSLNKRAWIENNRDKVRASRHKSAKTYRVLNRKKIRCWDLVYRAIVDGTLIRPAVCPRCKVGKEVTAHHSDYTKPFKITWVCRSCHSEIHRPALAAQP